MLQCLEPVGETLRAALNALAVLPPSWLQQRVPPEWFERYGSRVEHDDLPKTEAALQQLALVIGEDGQRLLQAIDRATDQPWLAQVPAMITLRRVWSEQYSEEHGQLRWREVKEMPAAADQLTALDDTDARDSTKRHLEWIGYKVHFTETCDAKTPHLMVHVETTPATTPDDHMGAVVHASLKPRHLLPSEHLVDKGYTDSPILVESQRHYRVTMVGPVADDPGWQAREGTGFDTSPCDVY
jgi:transposase